MNARLLPWAAMALLVLVLAVRSALSTNVVAVPAGATGPETAGGGPEIRLGPVDVRELHDDGSWNRLDADGAVYGYASRTVIRGGRDGFSGGGRAVRRDDRPRAARGVGPRREDDRASRGVPGGTEGRVDGGTLRGDAGPGGIGPSGPRTGEDRRPGRLRPGEEPRLGMGGGEDHDGVDQEPPLAGEGSRSEGVRPMRIPRIFAALSLVAALAGGAGAQESARASPPRDLGSRPIDVTADRLSADSLRNTVTFEGNVVARQADVTLYADRIQADYSREAGAIDRIEAEGNVRFVQEGREARSARATFHNLEQRIVLSGGRDAPAGAEHRPGRDAHHLPAGEPVRGDGRQGRRPRPGGDQPQGDRGDVTEVTGPERTGQDAHPHRRREDREGKSLAVEGLHKRYRRREVVKGVSLEARSGEVVGLLGPNGAGKTTIFYMMVGLVRPDEGEVRLNGAVVTDLPMHRRARMGLGYLPQEPSVFRKLSVRDNILAFLEETPLPPGERRERSEAILREMRIGHVSDTMGYALSGGERRRVEIARALVLSPDFLLLDEPFAGIDPISVADLQQVILGLKERGIGVIMTDHNVRDTLKVCDRAYIISEGEILLAGKPGEIAASDRVREIYLGDGFSL